MKKARGNISMSRCVTIASGLLLGATIACAHDSEPPHGSDTFQLVGFNQVPAVVTRGNGAAKLTIQGNSKLAYELSYQRLEGRVLQAHLHIGSEGTNGGIAAVLCSNLPDRPRGTPGCPASPGRMSGAIDASKVVGPAAQGIRPKELADLLEAVHMGVVYVDVHTTPFPDGEIRGNWHIHTDQ